MADDQGFTRNYSHHTIEELRFRHRFPGRTDAVLPLRVPAIRYPFPLRFNPHYLTIRDAHLHWCSSHGAALGTAGRNAAITADFAAMVALAYPYCSGPRLRILADYSIAITFLDALFDAPDNASRKRFYQDYRESFIRGYQKTDNLWARMFHDVDARFAVALSPRQRRRFRRHYELFLDGVATQFNQGVASSIRTYLQARRNNIGQRIDISFVEYGIEGLDLPDELIEHPLVEQLLACHVDYVLLTQDLLSCQSELAAEEAHNIVMVIASESGCPLQDAVDQAHRMVESALADWIRLRTLTIQALPRHHRALSAFIDGLDSFAVGWAEWTRWSPYYRHHRDPTPPTIDWHSHYTPYHYRHSTSCAPS